MSRLTKKKKMLIVITPEGEEDGLFYRTPTTDEVHAHQNEATQYVRGKPKNRKSQADLKFGKKVCIGIREKNFDMEDDNGEIRFISSDPQSPDYREDWKALIEEMQPTDFIALGAHVFGGAEAVVGEEDGLKN